MNMILLKAKIIIKKQISFYIEESMATEKRASDFSLLNMIFAVENDPSFF